MGKIKIKDLDPTEKVSKKKIEQVTGGGMASKKGGIKFPGGMWKPKSKDKIFPEHAGKSKNKLPRMDW